MDTVNRDTIKSAFKINVSPTIYALDKNKRIASSRMVRAEMIEEWLKENYKSTHQSKMKTIKLVECPRDAMQGMEAFIPTQQKINT